MDQHTPPDDRLRQQGAFQAAANAHLHLYLVLDDAMSYGGVETLKWSSAIIEALDASREAEAALLAYLPEPGISSAQVENAWQHSVAQVQELLPTTMERHEDGSVTLEFVTGPIQDQEPLTIEQQYETGLLSEAEYKQLVREAADNGMPIIAVIVEKIS